MSKKPGKRIRNLKASLDNKVVHSLSSAIEMVVKNSSATKFDETVDIVVILSGVDPKRSDQTTRGAARLPHGTGKKKRVAVFAKNPDKIEEAKKAGADLVGSDELIALIEKGEINFDSCIATPDMMPVISKVAKKLGPKGLMPNPKLGTVTNDIASAISNVKSGIEFRAESNKIVHAGVGKVSFGKEKLIDNINALVLAIKKAKPQPVKGEFIGDVYLTSTMGPSVKVDVSTIEAKE